MKAKLRIAGRVAKFAGWLTLLSPLGGYGGLHAQTFAAIQYSPSPVPSENLANLRALIGQAVSKGASAVVLPEHALLGPFPKEGSTGETAQFWQVSSAQSERLLAGLAKQYSIWIASSAPERAAGTKAMVINSVVFDHSGQLAKRQAKLLPSVAGGDGAATPGDFRSLGSLDFPGARIGVTSGDDLRKSVPRLAECGAETILVSASWEPADVIHWRDIARELAAANRVNLVISNLGPSGDQPGLRSVVISRNGQILAEATNAANEAVVGTVEPRGVAQRPPLGLPTMPYPALSLTAARDIELGKKLFFDAKLSQDGKTHCGTCHIPEKAFADGKRLAEGVETRVGHRNTPTLLNAGYKTFFGWDGASETMELQAQHALRGWAEMNMTLDRVTEYVKTAPDYASYREREITSDHVLASMTAYVRTLVSGDSPFDRHFYVGEQGAIGESAKRGLDVFMNKAKCNACHEIRREYALFSDNAFHNTGVGFHKRFEYLGYSGDGLENNQATKNRFRGEYITPSLRNIGLTAPYMHDGSLATLKDVVEYYNRGGNPNPFLDPRMKPLNLTPQEIADVVAFLETLTGSRETKSLHTKNRRN